jgi:hypothetical protein
MRLFGLTLHRLESIRSCRPPWISSREDLPLNSRLAALTAIRVPESEPTNSARYRVAATEPSRA